jgi:predicted nucleic acid-binding protein
VIVVADSTILIILLRARRLPLLHILYGIVTIPQRVWQEVVGYREEREDAAELLNARRSGWVSVVSPQTILDTTQLPRFRSLDPGEQQAILLALDYQPAILLVDERAAFSLVVENFPEAIDAATLEDVLEECIAAGLIDDTERRAIYRDANYRPATAVQRYRQEHPHRRPARPR